MSADLSTMFREAARNEAAAAEQEFPLTPATRTRIRGGIRRRMVAWGVAVSTAGVLALGAGAFAVVHLWPSTPVGPAALPSTSPSISPSPVVSASPSIEPSPLASPSPSIATPVPSPTAATPTEPEATVPEAVSGLTAGPGGGSGEILVRWTGTAEATGYRVYRASAPGDSMTLAASYSVVTGTSTVAYGGTYEFMMIWSPSTNTFEYVEAVDGQPGYFLVAAINSAGQGPYQGTVCAVPTGSLGTC